MPHWGWGPSGGGSGPTVPPTTYDLSARQARVYIYRATIYHPGFEYNGSGQETRLWAITATGVPFYLESSPSQFELQGEVIQAEGDNVFTLDKLHWPAAAPVEPDDVVQVTTGPAAILHGWWKIRGDLQPHVYRADKLVFIAGRIAEPPAGIPS